MRFNYASKKYHPIRTAPSHATVYESAYRPLRSQPRWLQNSIQGHLMGANVRIQGARNDNSNGRTRGLTADNQNRKVRNLRSLTNSETLNNRLKQNDNNMDQILPDHSMVLGRSTCQPPTSREIGLRSHSSTSWKTFPCHTSIPDEISDIAKSCVATICPTAFPW